MHMGKGKGRHSYCMGASGWLVYDENAAWLTTYSLEINAKIHCCTTNGFPIPKSWRIEAEEKTKLWNEVMEIQDERRILRDHIETIEITRKLDRGANPRKIPGRMGRLSGR